MRAVVAWSVAVLTCCAWTGAVAEPVGSAAPDARRAAPADASSQSVRPRRARTRIIIRPTRRFHRECDFWLVREVRASGTYVVPRQRCWWVPYRP